MFRQARVRHPVVLLVTVALFIVISLPAVAGNYSRPDILRMVSEQQGQDPIIGIWSGSAGGYHWQSAIVRNPDAAKDGVQFIGVLLKPWPFFKVGEVHIRFSGTGAGGTYQGQEKWKGALLISSWSGMTLTLQDATHLRQLNNINFDTPIGSDWLLVRETPVVSDQQQRTSLRQAGSSGANTAVVAASSEAGSNLIQSDVFFWYDEEPARPGQEVLQIVVTARAYDGVLDILRQVRGSNTEVKGGVNILETNYHPPTFRLGEWIAKHPDPNQIGSVFYWDDEVLGETTPVMSFYMTKHAYRSVINAVSQYLNQPAALTTLTSVQKQRRSGFLSALGIIAQGALEGMANYYAIVRPVEQARIAAQQAQSAQDYNGSQQLYELQSLNQNLSQINTQLFLDQIRRQGEQYSRMLQRYQTGTWPH